MTDDDSLLQALSEALHTPDPTPPGVLRAARAVYTWHTIDAELAELVHDSHADELVVAGLRAEEAGLRTLTFESPSLTVELGITAAAVIGQLVPPGPEILTLRQADGTATTVHSDDLGCFRISPPPPGLFTLTWRTRDGRQVTTSPFRLSGDA